MGKEPCSNCGNISCNGSDCYYLDDLEPDELSDLRTQLAAQTDLLAECLEIVQIVSKGITASDDQGQWCVFCQFWHDDYMDDGKQEHKPDCLMIKAAALLPRLKAATEGK